MVAVSWRQSLPSHLLVSPSHLEVLTVELSFPCSVIVCVVCISPNSSFSYCTEVFQYIETILYHKDVLILGDFNFPDISWSSFNGNSPQSDALCDLVYHHNLLQIGDFPTHLKGGILDLIFTNSEHLVANTTSFSSPFLLSDHFPISFTLSCASRKARVSSTTYSFNFKKTDILGLFSFLFDCDFSLLLASMDIEHVWLYLKNIILHLVTLFCPVVRITPRSLPQWFHSGIHHQLHRVRYLQKCYRNNPTSERASQIADAEV